MKSKYWISTVILIILGTSFKVFAQNEVVEKILKHLDSTHLKLISENATLAEEAKVLGLDWEKFYLKYMQAERKKAKLFSWPAEKIEVIGIAFGIFQGNYSDSLKELSITESRKNYIQDQLNNKYSLLDDFLEKKENVIEFTHPSKVYSIKYPKIWGEPKQFEYDKNIYLINDGSFPSFTISISENLKLPSQLSEDMFDSMFPNEEPIDDYKRNKGIGWNSISQIFEGDNGGEMLRWYATYFGFKSKIIAITLSAPKKSFDKYFELYKEIEKSIVFNY